MARKRTGPPDTSEPRPTEYVDVESALAPESVERLKAELDPNRVAAREGPGGRMLDYIAAHDAIRTANEIFGFGNWGHRIVELTRLGEIPVQSSGQTPKPGYLVGYACVVELSVRGQDERACVPVSGIGYGDGTEYGGETARVRASELAIKEAESDALKRALMKYGDQFGLVLYVKADERRKADSTKVAGETEPVRHVQQTAGQQHRDSIPRTWPELLAAFQRFDKEHPWGDWFNEAAQLLYGAKVIELKAAERQVLGQKVSTAYLKLDEALAGRDFPPPSRTEVQTAFAFVLDGAMLGGPEVTMDGTEAEAMRDVLPSETAETASSASEGSDVAETSGEGQGEAVSAGADPESAKESE